MSGGSAAVGIALVNAIGNVGGFIGPNLIGFLRTRAGGDTGAFLMLAAMAFVGGIDLPRDDPKYSVGAVLAPDSEHVRTRRSSIETIRVLSQ